MSYFSTSQLLVLLIFAGHFSFGFSDHFLDNLFESKGKTSPQPLVRANLVCGSMGRVLISHNSLTIKETYVKNIGDVIAKPSILGYYLSEDTDINREEDFRIGENTIRELQPSDSVSTTFSRTLVGIPEGTYYIGLVVDDEGDVFENDGNDNFCYFPDPRLIIGPNSKPDLVCFYDENLTVNDSKISIEGFDVCNIGTAGSGNSLTGVFLSADLDFDPEKDFLIGQELTGPIPVTSSYEIPECDPIYMKDIPLVGIPNGEYYVGIILDYDNQIEELNENNVCYFNSPKVNVNNSLINNPADLICLDPGNLNQNERNISIGGIKLQNIGEQEANAFSIAYFLSEDNIISPSDYKIGEKRFNSLNPQDSISQSFSTTLEESFQGSFYVGIILDFEDEVGEMNEANNTCFYPNPIHLANSPSKPNIVCNEQGTLSTNQSTNSLTISNFSVTNIGGTRAGKSTVGFYLSSDNIVDRNDQRIGEWKVDPLEPNEIHEFTQTFTNIGNGTYFVGMVVDDEGTVPETNGEDNFCHFPNPITFAGPTENTKANIICGDLGTLSVNGLEIEINGLQIKNIGWTDANLNTVGFYLSSDRNILRSDIRIGERIISEGIKAQRTEILSFSASLSAEDIPSGNYYLGIVVDDKGQVPETSGEDNFCLYTSAQVFIPESGGGIINIPNLICNDLGELNIKTSEIEVIGLYIKNIGNGLSDENQIGFYLSTDPNINKNDIKIGQEILEPLNPDEVSNRIDFSAPPNGIPRGTYYLGLIIDDQNELNETSKEDNVCLYDQFLIEVIRDEGPNLVCSIFSGFNANETKISIPRVEIQNVGDTPAGTFDVGYYLSSDDQLSPDDILIAERQVLRALKVGEKETLQTLEIPTNGIPNGEYRLAISVDFRNTVTERDEEDNFCVSTPKINIVSSKPNLVCGNLRSFDIENNEIHVPYLEIENIGVSRAGKSHIGYYLSRDPYISRTDILIGESFIPPIESNDKYIDSFRGSLSQIEAGIYYLGMVVDNRGEVSETSGEDNFCVFESRTIEIGDEAANLVCIQPSAISIDKSQIQITNLGVINAGESKASPSKLGIYLIDRDLSPASKVLLRDLDVPSLEPGIIYSRTQTLSVPKDIPQGIYYIMVEADYQIQVVESSAEDNICFYLNYPLQIQAQLPNLLCKGLGNLTEIGSSLEINDLVIHNNGEGTSEKTEIGIFFSTDPIIRTNDFFHMAIPLKALKEGESYSITEQVKDYNELPSGSYYVGLILDYKDQVLETNGEDNVCLFPSPKINVISNCDFLIEVKTQDATCGQNNGRAEAIITQPGSGNLAYSWSSGGVNMVENNLSTGIYSLTVNKDNRCNRTIPFEIKSSNFTNQSPSFTYEIDESGKVLFRNTSSPEQNFFWDFGDESPNDTAFEVEHHYELPRTYTVCLNVKNECDLVPIKTCKEIAIGASCNINLGEPNLVNPNCNQANGQIYIGEIDGGIRPYSHSWDNGDEGQYISGLDAGVYTVTVTDASGCQSKESYTLVSENRLSGAGEPSEFPGCNSNDGEFTVFVSGGIAPYNFEFIEPGLKEVEKRSENRFFLSNLGVGTHKYIISDKQGCFQAGNFIMDSKDGNKLAKAKFEVSRISENDSIVLYLFSNKSENQRSSTWNFGSEVFPIDSLEVPFGFQKSQEKYKVSLKVENFCNSDIQSLTLNLQNEDPCQLEYNINAKAASCGKANASAEIIVSPEKGDIRYEWLTNPPSLVARSRNLRPGTYHVVLTQKLNGETCRDTIEVELKGNEGYPRADFEFEFLDSTQVKVKDLSYRPDSYVWIANNDPSTRTTEIIPTFDLNGQDSIIITLIVSNVCGVDTLSKTGYLFGKGSNNDDKLDEEEEPNSLRGIYSAAPPWQLFPNPNSGEFSISGLRNPVKTRIIIRDVMGRKILVQSFIPISSEYEWVLRDWKPSRGNYWVEIHQMGYPPSVRKVQIY